MSSHPSSHSRSLLGKGDTLLVTQKIEKENTFGLIYASHFVIRDEWYSQYGLAIPVRLDDVPMDVILEGKYPLAELKLEHTDPVHPYLLLDHDGKLWGVILTVDSDGRVSRDMVSIDTTTDRWWVKSNSITGPAMGLLIANVSPDTFIEKALVLYPTTPTEVFSLTNLLVELHVKHPTTPKETEGDGSSS
jgi:hypothetical protein